MGPLVDRFGPRKTMAAILIVGAIPSGLAGTVTSYEGLLVLRFFIGILGASFVPALCWSTAFFDKVCDVSSGDIESTIATLGASGPTTAPPYPRMYT